jgi:cardiolipin synthase
VPDGDLSRIATVPNVITFGRLVVLALFLLLLFGAGDRLAATGLLVVAGATDFLDGYLARRLGQVSTLGKVIDPIADRLVLATVAVSVIVYGAVPLWLGVLVLAREAAVSLATVVLAALGARRMDVVWFGKAGTFGMMVALPLFLLGDGGGGWAPAASVAAWVCVVPAELALLAAGGIYLSGCRAALEQGRARRALDERAGRPVRAAGRQ